MPQLDPRVDAYIEKSAAFARPILEHFRALVHRACPGVVETIKWKFPHFEYQGPFCSMAAFKEHCAFGFWKAELLTSAPDALASRDAMGQFGRVTSQRDLPSDKVILALLREAMVLNEQKVPSPRAAAARAPKELVVPGEITAALEGNDAARAMFDSFTYSQKKDYVTWFTEAKTDATRARRLATMIEWIAEGKSRNWKYER